MNDEESHLGFNETVELLSNTLPNNALEHLRAEDEVVQKLFAQREITNKTILPLLDDQGVRRYQIVRYAVNQLLQLQNINRDESDIYHKVEPELKGDKNPFLLIVKKLIA